MKILIYNWLAPGAPSTFGGGGVHTYVNNVLRAFAERSHLKVTFLSSGSMYSAMTRRPYFKMDPHYLQGPIEGIQSFSIWNSEVPAPGSLSFANPASISAPATITAFGRFVDQHGPFDVVHFNNIEGLPIAVLGELKRRYPSIKVIFSLHNYHLFCPQVNLWWRESERCIDYADGSKCTSCVMSPPNVQGITTLRRARSLLRTFGAPERLTEKLREKYISLRNSLTRSGRAAETGQSAPREIFNILNNSEVAYLRRRRQSHVEHINSYVDRVLCMSKYVAGVATRFGVSDNILRVDYIGTRHAATAARHPRKCDYPGKVLSLGYLGYMRRDKGFYFLIDSLSQMPPELAKSIRIVIAAKCDDPSIKPRLAELKLRLNDVRFYDGYTQNDLDTILKDVDVGVVPVMWEDNLPQVAIEMMSRGCPIITSNLGGAQELGGCNPDFVFSAGDSNDFTRIVRQLVSRETSLSAYWAQAMKLTSMEEHQESLLRHYGLMD